MEAMGLARLLHWVVNVPFIKRMITGNRTLVRLYFDWKYRREDPYGLLKSDFEKTKLDTLPGKKRNSTNKKQT